ncbi:MAG: sulfatase [Deltaproteobacteria bacterium]|nr:sulfatase [Deltaproteobacteria bacterium]
MTRRVSRLIGFAILYAATSGLSADPALASEPPNVLFITVDDIGWDSVGVNGSKVVDATPNIDALASEGLRFEHGHVTVAICRPSRSVWMTGLYPHNSGAKGFTRIYNSVPTLPETLTANGYTTGIIGKTRHVIPSRKRAFDYQIRKQELMGGYSAVRFAEAAADFFVLARQSKRPFFLMVNTHDAHRPFDDGKPAEERSLASGANGGGDLPAPSKIYQTDEVPVPGFLPDLPEVREDVARYYNSVRRADDVVGAVLQALGESGFEKKTLVMLMSDNGVAMPFAKTNVWRHSTRTPWIVRWPGVTTPGAHDSKHMIAGVDFAPTILAAAGLQPQAEMDGRSFLPLLQGKEQAGREYVYTYLDSTARDRSYVMRSIQDVRYGYIWNSWSNGRMVFRNESDRNAAMRAIGKKSESDPVLAARVKHFRYRVPEEFYDYEKDPDALHNLIDDPAVAGRVSAFRAKLLDHMERTRDPKRTSFKKVAVP